jgi:CMP-N,N'-diacetyllegionaminic acid synthase
LEPIFIIPARSGSKGIAGKNIKPLAGIPLLHFTIAFARQFADDAHICLTTESSDIIKSAKKVGLKVPFIRPAHLASDHAGSYAVIRHALQKYQQAGKSFDPVVLLQPTSPFRKGQHLEEALALYGPRIDMVVSVTISDANPYFNLYEENPSGFLGISKGSHPFTDRQSAPPVYRYNGSIYVINPLSLMRYEAFGQFPCVKKYVMDAAFSVDLDTAEDWQYAEYLAATRFKKQA